MTSNWIEDSRELLLEQAKESAWLQKRMGDPAFYDDLMRALAPLEDGTIDPGDEDSVVDSMISMLGEEYLPSLRRIAEIQIELHDFYSRLQEAADDEVQAFAHMSLKAYLQGSGALETLLKLAKDAKAAREAPVSEDEDEAIPWAT